MEILSAPLPVAFLAIALPFCLIMAALRAIFGGVSGRR